jgi:hypothetical protein
VRGPAAEACEQPAGVQLWPPRGPRGQDPPLVQLRQLAPHGGGPGQAAIRARPTCRLRQGTLRPMQCFFGPPGFGSISQRQCSGSMTFWCGSGCGSGSFYFHH